jgi:hypothetical protein
MWLASQPLQTDVKIELDVRLKIKLAARRPKGWRTGL